MFANRKLDEKLIDKLLPLLEKEEVEAEDDYNDKDQALRLAKQRLREARAHVKQMRGEVDVDDDPPAPDPSPPLIPNLVEDPKPNIRFWEEPNFNWRKFIPAYIREQDMLFSTADFIELAQMDAVEKDKYDSTISSALWELTKPVAGILIGFQFPQIRGAYYGSASFFESRTTENQKLGVLKREYAEKLSLRLNRPMPML